MNKYTLCFLLVAGLVLLGGCEMKNFVGPKEIPVWLAIRQINGIERDYELEREDALEAVKQAITSQGGTVRYYTEVGTSRTVYGKTDDGEGIIVDIDPYHHKPGMTEIDVSVTMYGDKKRARKLLSGIDQYLASKNPTSVIITEPQQPATPNGQVVAEAQNTSKLKEAK